MKLFTTPAFEKRQIPTAPRDSGPFFSGFRIAAVAIAEVFFELFAYPRSTRHKISTPVVFAQQQSMIPSRFAMGFPSRQRHAAVGAHSFLIVHFDYPPTH